MKSGKRKKLSRLKSPAVVATVSTKPGRSRAIRFLLPLAVFCWPILYLFRYVFPIDGQYTAIGNDFIVLYYKYKVYLLAHLAEFRFPLWSPAEAAGFPFYTNPFAQAFYPLNLPLAVWYKLAGGYNALDHQVFTVLGISIFALGLFMWLRLVNTNLRAVIFSVLVMSVSFKMTEILRFPNAVHSAAWYPWVLYALTRIMLTQSLKSTLWGGVLLTFSLICLCTGGYPYYLYYAQFLFLPYVVAFLVKPLRLRLFGVQAVHWKRVFGTLAVAGFVTLLVCGPYLLGVKQLMSETTDRTGKDFEYSTSHVFTFEDTLGSFVYPPAAMQDGWNFFGIAGLLVILSYLMKGGAVARNPLPACYSERETPTLLYTGGRWTARLFFIIWIALIIYITYGRHSYLFILLWKFMPGFSALRVWARLNIILVPILAWLLSLAYASFESTISAKETHAVGRPHWAFLSITGVAAAYTVVLAIQLYFYLNEIYDPYWPEYFNNLSPQRVWFVLGGAAAFVVVLLLVILAKRNWLRSVRSLRGVLAVLLLVAVVEMRPVGTHIWTYEGKPQKNRVHLDIPRLNEASFRFPRTDHENSIPLGPSFSVGVLENWYFNRYVRFLKETEDELPARRILLGVQDGTRIFFSESIEHATVQSFLRDAMRYRPAGSLLSYTGDELKWEAEAPVAGYLSFIDNWDWGWQAFVDDKPAEIKLLFGTFKSVTLPPGRHRVRFSYQPGFLPLFKNDSFIRAKLE
ncbi:MAG TPA: hypothetical protein VMW16_16515 [Sedimentisphaerales bacterium]|nr:hypothetical protein [Sedimentisphaerales bacterium]